MSSQCPFLSGWLHMYNIHHMYNIMFFEYISEYYTEFAVPTLYISVRVYFKTI
jgi:hypothetical protein